MTLFTIPARNDFPWYFFRITLDNVLYQMLFRYNTRMARWILDLQDSSGNPVLSGIPLLVGRNLAEQYPEAGLPPGDFFIIDNAGEGDQPTLLSFGTSHTLYYLSPS